MRRLVAPALALALAGCAGPLVIPTPTPAPAPAPAQAAPTAQATPTPDAAPALRVGDPMLASWWEPGGAEAPSVPRSALRGALGRCVAYPQLVQVLVDGGGIVWVDLSQNEAWSIR